MINATTSTHDYYIKTGKCSKIEKNLSDDEYEASFLAYRFKNISLFNSGLLLTEDHYAIKDSFLNMIFFDESIKKIKNESEFIFLADTEYISLLGSWSHNLWHWLFDYLTNVVIAENFGFNGKYIVRDDYFLLNKLATLNLLGVSNDRVVIQNKDSNFFIQKFLLVNKISLDDERLFILLNIIRSTFLKILKKSDKNDRRIYISREKLNDPLATPNTNGRYIYNESEVWKLLKSYGFEKLYMEDLSISEQIGIASESSFLIGGHGSGITHSLFMPEKSHIIEFFSPTYVNYCSSMITTKLLSHDYRMLLPEVCGKYKHGTKHNAPVEVHIGYFEIMLDNILG